MLYPLIGVEAAHCTSGLQPFIIIQMKIRKKVKIEFMMPGPWWLCVCSKEWGSVQQVSFLHWTSPDEGEAWWQKKNINLSYFHTMLNFLWWKSLMCGNIFTGRCKHVSLGNAIQVCAKIRAAGESPPVGIWIAIQSCFWYSTHWVRWKQKW